jgi:hypothetical protein
MAPLAGVGAIMLSGQRPSRTPPALVDVPDYYYEETTRWLRL